MNYVDVEIAGTTNLVDWTLELMKLEELEGYKWYAPLIFLIVPSSRLMPL